jgi:serine/threonine protein kinase
MPCLSCDSGERMTWNIGDTILGKYRVERLLGQGGMGVVLAVRHVQLGELYAMKMMHTRLPAGDDAAGRFVREARASARLKGDHVARVHDVGRTDEGDLYMVMDYLEGLDLKTYLAQNGRLPVEEAVDYILQACEGIGEAHEMGIVHRDIKPANLFLVRNKKTGQALIKVLDFGISKNMNPGESTDLTQSGTMLGSPLYMSPEQMQYAHRVDSRTDIWSLGVVLYELLTGKVPFPGETMTQVVHSVMNLEPQSVQYHVPTVPASIDAVIKQCLKKGAELRLSTIDGLVQALQSSLNDAAMKQVGPDVTIKEKPAAVPTDPALEATAAAIAFEPTTETPVPKAVLIGTDRIPANALKIEESQPPVSRTLESGPISRKSTPQEVSEIPPRRASWGLMAILAIAVLGIGVYWAFRLTPHDENVIVSAPSASINMAGPPRASASSLAIVLPLSPSSSVSAELLTSAIATRPSVNAPAVRQNSPKPLATPALAPGSSEVLPPPAPPPAPASPSVTRWNGPL